MEFRPWEKHRNETVVDSDTQAKNDEEMRSAALRLFAVMEKQGAAGITQPVDYRDALAYTERYTDFCAEEVPEGSITEIFRDIIFDFDGVLYDSSRAMYKTTQHMLHEQADPSIPLPRSHEEVANSYHPPFQEYYKRFGIALETKEEIDAFKVAYRNLLARNDREEMNPSAIYPEVLGVLQTILEAKKEHPHLRVHIVSAGAEKYIAEVLDAHNITGVFDTVFSECHSKSAAIRAIAEKNAHAHETVMIGDLPGDIKDAQETPGVRTIAVARGGREQERLGMYLPDYLVQNLQEIFDLRSYHTLAQKNLPK